MSEKTKKIIVFIIVIAMALSYTLVAF